MIEWVLIITMNIQGKQQEVRDIDATVITGFEGKASCDTAGNKLAQNLISMVGSHREAQGIQGNLNIQAPAIWHRCIAIEK